MDEREMGQESVCCVWVSVFITALKMPPSGSSSSFNSS